MLRYRKIIFVSEENTYASPVAEALLKAKLKKMGDEETEVASRGRVVLFPEPANPKGVAIAKSRGIDMEEHRACPMTEEEFGSDVLILVMTERIKVSIYEDYKNAVNVYTVREFLDLRGDIDTPYGKGMKEYGESYTQIEELTDKLIKKLK